MITALLLIISNIFMTLAWYGHLKVKQAPLWIAIAASWGLAFFEYLFQVPANRIGSARFDLVQLKVMQECITIIVFVAIAWALAVIYSQSFADMVGAQIVMGVVGTFFPPAMAGMTLGIVGRAGLDWRIGRNETFNHAGNVFGAVAAGLLGYIFARESIFYFTAASCVITIVAICLIRADEIDFAWARGCEKGEVANEQNVSGFREVLINRSLSIFILSVVLFHFANAAMLPLVG